MSRRIVKTGGRARISNTRIEVHQIVEIMNGGANLSKLCERFPILTISDIEMVQRYYKKNKAEIDEILEK